MLIYYLAESISKYNITQLILKKHPFYAIPHTLYFYSE